MHTDPRPRSRWPLLVASLALLVAGALFGGLEGGIGASMVVLVVAVNQLDTVRSASTDRRFSAQVMLLARPSVAVHRGWDAARARPCLLVLIDPGPRVNERGGAVIAERAFQSLRSGPRYAEGITGEGRLLWVFELASEEQRRITLIDRTPLAG